MCVFSLCLHRANEANTFQAALQRTAQHPAQQAPVPPSVPPQARNGNPATSGPHHGHVSSALPSGLNPGTFPAQAGSHSILQAPTNNAAIYGNGGGTAATPNLNNALGVKAVPQAHMHPQQRLPQVPTNEMRLMIENNRIQQEQRRFLQQQQQGNQLQFHHQQGHGQVGPAPSPAINSLNGLGRQVPLQNNPAMLAALQAASNVHGMNAPASNNINVTAGQSSSPRMGQAPLSQLPQPQSLSSGLVPAINAIQHHIKARNAGASPEQIKRMTNEQLAAQYQRRLSQSAMNASAGGNNSQPVGLANDANNHVHQRYAQMIRAQQASQSQSKVVPPVPNGVRTPSRGATPQTQRLPNVQSSPVPSQSPRPPQAQMARGP